MQPQNRRDTALIYQALQSLADPKHPRAATVACLFFGIENSQTRASHDALQRLFDGGTDLLNGSPRSLFFRWLTVTERLHAIGLHETIWAWAMLGVTLCQRIEHQFPVRWRGVLAATQAIRQRTGIQHPELLPHDPTELLVSAPEIARVERQLLHALTARRPRSQTYRPRLRNLCS